MNALALVTLLLAGEVRLGLGRYAVDPAASSIGFDGSSSLHDFTAKAGRFGGEARIDPSDLATLAGGTVWIETASLDSGSKGRDGDMKDLLESTRHPRISFTLERAEGALDAWRGDLRLRGKFAVRGVEKDRVVAARIEPRSDGFRAVGEVRFRMSEHGIKPPRLLLIKTADEVRVWFDLAFRRVAARDLPALVRAVEIRERAELAGGAGEGRRETSRIWSVGERVLWERPGAWRVASSEGVLGFLPAQGRSLPSPEAAEEGIPLIRETGREGPASRPAGPRPIDGGRGTIVRDGEVVRVQLDGEDRVVFEGLAGEERFPQLLAALPRVPSAVRGALGSLRGIPGGVELTTTGRNRARVTLGPPQPGIVPNWAIEPERWTEPTPGAR